MGLGKAKRNDWIQGLENVKGDLEKATGEKIREKVFEENVKLCWRLKINVKICLCS